MRATIILVFAVLALVGCGGGGGGDSGPARDVQDALTASLADEEEEVFESTGCEQLGTGQFRCTIHVRDGDYERTYDQTYTCDLEGLCTNGSYYFRVP